MHPRYSLASKTADDMKQAVLPYVPTDSKVIATASARVYHAPFGNEPEQWTFSGLSGTLVFGRDRFRAHPDRTIGTGPGTSSQVNYWFRLVDLVSGKGLVWIHQIPQFLDYRADKPFFHIFQAKTRMFGFRFDEDVDASKFHKKVTNHVHPKGPDSVICRKGSKKATDLSGSPKRISPSSISSPAPNSFVHINHAGFSEKGDIVVSDDIEPGWSMMLEELHGYGATNKTKSDNGFMDGFLAGLQSISQKSTNAVVSSETYPDRKRKVVRRKPVVPFV
ncbi:hypothetical protein NLI96_g10439 [Meripilus lineatus]|uniref:WH1 domain-containing protein n=1 Tax=Meripilus lineatus TaxID=2056292 RepID=A0AAD5YE86_9APHY|nr:hypothetical protein NLI96_g10439 [Physisporinus lineatus]